MRITKYIWLFLGILVSISNLVDAQSFFPAGQLFFQNNIYNSDFEKEIFLDIQDGKSTTPLAALVCADSNASEEIFQQFDGEFSFITNYINKKGVLKTSDEDKLKKLFDLVQIKYLHHYKIGQTLQKTLITGNYDCLTATSIYAVLLQKLGYNYEIKETPHHVYLVVNLKNGKRKILFESTDRKNGFITDPAEVKEREISYAKQSSESYTNILKMADSHAFESDNTRSKKIDLMQLCGLQYFNECVKFYNKGLYKEAFVYAEKAFIFYPSDRIGGMALITLQQINAKEKYCTPLEKVYYSQKLRTYYSATEYLVSDLHVHASLK